MKKFLTIDEQINFLKKEKKLKIIDEEKLRYYISSYNYKNVIKRYNRFFFDNNFEGGTYLNNITSNDIISIFNFDRALSQMMLPNLLNIERKLATAISSVLCEKFLDHKKNTYIPEMEGGLLTNISNKDFSYIFPKLFSDEIVGFKYQLVKNSIKSSKIKNKYSIIDEWNVRNVPIWELSVNWTFSVIIEILKNIRKELRTEIIKFYFQKDIIHEDIINNFICIIKLLDVVKNRNYHNNQIFDIELKNERDNINRFIDAIDLRDNFYAGSKSLRLFEVILIIDYFWHLREFTLFDRVIHLLRVIMEKDDHRKNTWKKLLCFMKLYKFVV